jgi:pyrroloquinoline quinone biosynthesis protein D
MAMDDTRARLITAEARPQLRAGVRLIESDAHGGWVLLAPERVFKINAVAADILQRCDGRRTFAEIVDNLTAEYRAPRARVEADASGLLDALADKLLLDA